jgi:hypothetical protein
LTLGIPLQWRRGSRGENGNGISRLQRPGFYSGGRSKNSLFQGVAPIWTRLF